MSEFHLRMSLRNKWPGNNEDAQRRMFLGQRQEREDALAERWRASQARHATTAARFADPLSGPFGQSQKVRQAEIAEFRSRFTTADREDLNVMIAEAVDTLQVLLDLHVRSRGNDIPMSERHRMIDVMKGLLEVDMKPEPVAEHPWP